MKAVVTSQAMARADHHTIHRLGIPGSDLMERAATACTDVLAQQLKPNDKVTVCCGPGNNGGDGFAIARQLHEQSVAVSVISVAAADRIRGDAAKHYQRLLQCGCPVQHISRDFELSSDTTWIVDALLGTGLTSAVREPYDSIIAAINQHPARVLAVDLPSGLCGDDGVVRGLCVHADITVTFEAMKFAHVITPASLLCGQVHLCPIGIRFDETPTTYAVSASDYHRAPRAVDGHKGSFGTLGVLGGFAGLEGAASLTALAALRFGAGKVRILCDQPQSARFSQPSVMTGHVQDLGDYSALVFGPGLSRTQRAQELTEKLDLPDIPVVWDADALFFLNSRTRSLGRVAVITPHPGEAAHLLGCSTAEVQADRLSALRDLRDRFPHSFVVLKGYRTLVATPHGDTYVNLTGNSALATAGSGDVLAGMIGAMLAQSESPDDAVLMSIIRHGMAADHWVTAHPDHAMIAEDIMSDLTRFT
ncbi:MAG: NAD(P)H-hydrate dehydratase [Acidobacteria bacterium]|nr:NAD(P)H-hydrate dehydratase [Acidobacteriota bacterium]